MVIIKTKNNMTVSATKKEFIDLIKAVGRGYLSHLGEPDVSLQCWNLNNSFAAHLQDMMGDNEVSISVFRIDALNFKNYEGANDDPIEYDFIDHAVAIIPSTGLIIDVTANQFRGDYGKEPVYCGAIPEGWINIHPKDANFFTSDTQRAALDFTMEVRTTKIPRT